MLKPSSLSPSLPFLCLFLLLSGCTLTRQLNAHRATLNDLAYGDYTPQEKFDGLANTMVGVMDESLRIINPAKTYRYLDKFSAQNEDALTTLYTELNGWRNEMGTAQKVGFGARTLTKSYTRRLPGLANKLEKRLGSRLTQLLLLTKVAGLLKVNKQDA